MPKSPSDHTDLMNRFVESIRVALREDEASGAKPPVERRKVKTMAAACRQGRTTTKFLSQLDVFLRGVGIYTEPPLLDSPLQPNDWVLFSTGPFPPDSAFFPNEKDLQRFVESCLGSGALRGLELYKSGKEFRLPNGQRVDLLCQERSKSGPGALVAIELKRMHQRGTIEQLMGYMDQLAKMLPPRPVKGIIISGREDQVAAALLKDVKDYDIKWLCYHVSFDALTASS